MSQTVDRPVTVSYLKRLRPGAAVITGSVGPTCLLQNGDHYYRRFFNIFQNRNGILGFVHKE